MSADELRVARELIARPELEARCEGVELLKANPDPAARDALIPLLEESSWYLRERVVSALAGRDDAVDGVTGLLKTGAWFARASACDVLAASGRIDLVPPLLEQVEDRNVSLQKSAVRALRKLAGEHGSVEVARRVAALPTRRRRRVVARIGHQEPEWAPELQRALGEVPPEDFGSPEEPPTRSIVRRHEGTRADRALVRFRKWLHELPTGGEPPWNE